LFELSTGVDRRQLYRLLEQATLPHPDELVDLELLQPGSRQTRGHRRWFDVRMAAIFQVWISIKWPGECQVIGSPSTSTVAMHDAQGPLLPPQRVDRRDGQTLHLLFSDVSGEGDVLGLGTLPTTVFATCPKHNDRR
jgi:hypothetical protein